MTPKKSKERSRAGGEYNIFVFMKFAREKVKRSLVEKPFLVLTFGHKPPQQVGRMRKLCEGEQKIYYKTREHFYEL